MFFRVGLGGLLGGVAVFLGGFVTHMAFNWSGRTFSQLANEPEIRKVFTDGGVKPGIYMFPSMAHDLPSDKMESEWNRVNELYKQGPAAFVVVHPTGNDMMSGTTLGLEFATNVIAALFAAAVVAQFGAERGFLTRWLAVVGIGVLTWFSVTASYGIWYRFPWPFVRDELLIALVEWSLAGLAIAAVVRPRRPV